MKKINIYFFLFLLFFQAHSCAYDVYNLKIEGISLGDSLLKHLSKEEITAEIEDNKAAYNYLTDEFGEVYLYQDFEKYAVLAFKVKPKDKNYRIYSIKASNIYDDQLDMCTAKQKEIENEFSLMFNNAKKRKVTYTFPFDPSGESISINTMFTFKDESQIDINCTKYKKSLKIKNGWQDALQIIIQSKEVMSWHSNHIN